MRRSNGIKYGILFKYIVTSRIGIGVIVLPSVSGGRRDETTEPELVRDMLTIVTSCAERLYGQRSTKARRLRAVMAAGTRSSVAA